MISPAAGMAPISISSTHPPTRVLQQGDSTGAYLLAYAMPLKKTYLTGKRKSPALQIDRAGPRTASSMMGVAGPTRTAPVSITCDEYRNPAPAIGQLVAGGTRARRQSLGRRNDAEIVPGLMGLLQEKSKDGRIGACQGIIQRGRAAAAIPLLREGIAFVRPVGQIKAAEALAAIGKPAQVAVPELLARLSRKASSKDPRNMEQRYLTFALFSHNKGLIGRIWKASIARRAKAVRASLLNQDGRARGAVSSVYRNLSFDQLKPGPLAIWLITVRAPSGIMFAHEICMAGLELFSRYHVAEGSIYELLADYVRDMKPHASEHRIVKVVEMLEKYGAHAQRVIPTRRTRRLLRRRPAKLPPASEQGQGEDRS